jgi:DNA-binding MarR family transcriptional regulator
VNYWRKTTVVGILFPMAQDFVDWVIGRWSEERPELDLASISVVGRLLRIANLLEQRFERLFREHGFSFWAFTVLTALRRVGEPYRLSPSQLQSAGMVSAAAVTKRISRLEQLGLIERVADPNDGRGTFVGLTRRGLQLIDNLGERYLEEERAAIAALDPEQQAALAELLKQLLLGLEGPRTGPSPLREPAFRRVKR